MSTTANLDAARRRLPDRPAGTEEAGERTRFDRRELKFLVSDEQARRLTDELRMRMDPDEHGDRSGRYSILSLYYDGPAWDCYWERARGVKNRRKLRLRRYEGGVGRCSFLEIKQRKGKRVTKRRTLMGVDEALGFCEEALSPGGPERADGVERAGGVEREIAHFVRERRLRPTCYLRYERQALVGRSPDSSLRVTVDRNLAYEFHPSVRGELATPAGAVLPPELCVLEVKVVRAVPWWLAVAISRHELTLSSTSKYSFACESAGVLRRDTALGGTAAGRTLRPPLTRDNR